MTRHRGLILIKSGNIVLITGNGRTCAVDVAALSHKGHVVGLQGNGGIQGARLRLPVKVCALKAAAQLTVGHIACGGGEVLIGIRHVLHRFLGRNNGAVLIHKGADHHAVIVRRGLAGFVDPHGERADVAGLAGDGNPNAGVTVGVLGNDIPSAAGRIIEQHFYDCGFGIQRLGHGLIHLHFKSEFFAFGSEFQIYVDDPISVCLLCGGYGAVIAGLGYGYKVFLACREPGKGGRGILFKSGLGNILGAGGSIVFHGGAVHEQRVSAMRRLADRQIRIGHFKIRRIRVISCHKRYRNVVLAIVIAVGRLVAVGIGIGMVDGDIDAHVDLTFPHSHQGNGRRNG